MYRVVVPEVLVFTTAIKQQPEKKQKAIVQINLRINRPNEINRSSSIGMVVKLMDEGESLLITKVLQCFSSFLRVSVLRWASSDVGIVRAALNAYTTFGHSWL